MCVDPSLFVCVSGSEFVSESVCVSLCSRRCKQEAERRVDMRILRGYVCVSVSVCVYPCDRSMF